MWLKKTLTTLLDLALPPLCFACDTQVSTKGALCAECWKNIRFTAEPWCARCGVPFDLPVEKGTLCGRCIAEEPRFDMARAAMIYDEGSKGIILRFKHADRLHPAQALAGLMHRCASDFWSEADLIIPVPLHRWRLLKRRYNQAAVLALALGKIDGKEVIVDGLVRTRATESQGHMNREQRRKNIHNAIGVNPKRTNKLKGKSVILVDDVMTTGATANEACRHILKGGAQKVFVLTLAHTSLAD